MLGSFIFTQKWLNFLQSSIYLDYLVKKFSETFIKNTFIYTLLFFGEKYIIEYWSKKSVEYIILFLNKKATNFFYYNFFFLQVIIFMFYVFFFLELFYIFF